MCKPYITWTPSEYIDMYPIDNITILNIFYNPYNANYPNAKEFIRMFNIISKFLYNIKHHEARLRFIYNGELYHLGQLVMDQNNMGLVRVEQEPGSELVLIPINTDLCNISWAPNIAAFSSIRFRESESSIIKSFIKSYSYSSMEIDLLVKSSSHKFWWDAILSIGAKSKFKMQVNGYKYNAVVKGDTISNNNNKNNIGPDKLFNSLSFNSLSNIITFTNESPNQDYEYIYKFNVYFNSLFIENISTSDNNISWFNSSSNNKSTNNDSFSNIILLSSEPIQNKTFDLLIKFYLDVKFIENKLIRYDDYTLKDTLNNFSDRSEKDFICNISDNLNLYIKNVNKKIILNPLKFIEVELIYSNNEYKYLTLDNNNNFYFTKDNLSSINIYIPSIYVTSHVLNIKDNDGNTHTINFKNNINNTAVATINKKLYTYANGLNLNLNINQDTLTIEPLPYQFIFISDNIEIVSNSNMNSSENNILYSNTGNPTINISNFNSTIYSPTTDYQYKEKHNNVLVVNNKKEISSFRLDEGKNDIYYDTYLISNIIVKKYNAITYFELQGVENENMIFQYDKSKINPIDLFDLIKTNNIDVFTSTYVDINNINVIYNGPSDIYKLEGSVNGNTYNYSINLTNGMNHKLINSDIPERLVKLKLIDINSNKYLIIKITHDTVIYLNNKVKKPDYALELIDASTKKPSMMYDNANNPEQVDKGQYINHITSLTSEFEIIPRKIKLKIYPNRKLTVTIRYNINSTIKTMTFPADNIGLGQISDSISLEKPIIFVELKSKDIPPARFHITIISKPKSTTLKSIDLTYNELDNIEQVSGNITKNNIDFNLNTQNNNNDKSKFKIFFKNYDKNTTKIHIGNLAVDNNPSNPYILQDININKIKKLTIYNNNIERLTYKLNYKFEHDTSFSITNITTNLKLENSFKLSTLIYTALIPKSKDNYYINITLSEAITTDHNLTITDSKNHQLK